MMYCYDRPMKAQIIPGTPIVTLEFPENKLNSIQSEIDRLAKKQTNYEIQLGDLDIVERKSMVLGDIKECLQKFGHNFEIEELKN